MNFRILEWRSTDFDRFTHFWAERYSDPREHLYVENIGLPLTAERVRSLFRWKNGGKLSQAKLRSVEVNYIERIPELAELPSDISAADFLQRWDEGGAIWRIFWMHCHAPDRFPILDQHVYRAAAKIAEWDARELPAADQGRVRVYLDRYLPFWSALPSRGRDVDRALWTYGKLLKVWGGTRDPDGVA